MGRAAPGARADRADPVGRVDPVGRPDPVDPEGRGGPARIRHLRRVRGVLLSLQQSLYWLSNTRFRRGDQGMRRAEDHT
jgi:hypothetical protein